MARQKKQIKIQTGEDDLGSDLNQFVTTGEAAELLGVIRSSVNHLIYSGRIQGKKFGRDWLIYRPSLISYLQSKSTKGRPSTNSPRLKKG